ncbi:MAG: Dabb family protein, partial [Mediterranea sp.]|nr:Dabb family protein [Mediterranea sp.]
DKIPVICKMEVGFNSNTNENWHIALYSEFESLEDLKLYAAHPEHIAAGKIIAGIKESRACVDYQY